MKHLKYLESFKNIPEIGDYIFYNLHDPDLDEDYKKYINNNIGVLIDIDIEEDKEPTLDNLYFIEYDLSPLSIGERKKIFDTTDNLDVVYAYGYEIEYFSKDKDDVLMHMQSKKYNI